MKLPKYPTGGYYRQGIYLGSWKIVPQLKAWFSRLLSGTGK